MENLHNQLIQACEYYAILDRYDHAVQTLLGQNVDLDIDYDNIKRKGFRAAPGILIIIFTGILLFFAAITACVLMTQGTPYEQLATPLSTLLGMFIIMLMVGGILLYKLGFCRARTRKIQQAAQQQWHARYDPVKAENELAIDRLIAESNVFTQKACHVLDFLPDMYRSQLAVVFMEQAVRAGRADTLKEAINIYEEQLHRWTLEAQGRQLLRQKEMQTAMIHDHLTSILNEQRRAANSLQSIETLAYYNTFYR